MFYWAQGGGGMKEGMRWGEARCVSNILESADILFELEKEREYNELREEKSG